MRRSRSSYFDAERPRVEVIPMIDIMMFLLVFFVVISLRMIAGTGVPMELPSAASTTQLVSATITVGVTKQGDAIIDGQTVDLAGLKAKLLALKAERAVDVVLAGDKDVTLQMLLRVMDTVRAAGIGSVGVAAQAQPK
jgi:biopolymer transport protein ExbD